jgi:PleD family two-component response regulator
LVVDDSAVYRKLIGDYLRSWGFTVTLAEDGASASRVLSQSDSPKLVLLDGVLPDLKGIELCQRIRETGSSGHYIYVILLTSNDGRHNMLEAMQAGADDYLVKPVDELELKARLLVGKRILNLQEELVAARESMRHAATHDSLTALMNRGEIVAMLQRELEFWATSTTSRKSMTRSAIFSVTKCYAKPAAACERNSVPTTVWAAMEEKNFFSFFLIAICPLPCFAPMNSAN